MAEKPSAGDHTGFKSRFWYLDKDNVGVIPVSKLGELMESLGYKVPDMERCIKIVDPKGTGLVKYQDFVSLMDMKFVQEGECLQEELYYTFLALDPDGDGYIRLDQDLPIALNILGYGADVPVDMIIESRAVGLRNLSFPEFRRMVMNADIHRSPQHQSVFDRIPNKPVYHKGMGLPK